jgi:ATP-binding cassette subfamily B protein
VAHRLSTVRNAHRIIVLHRGQIIETGDHGELMKRKGFYYKLHQLQNGRVLE